MTILRIGFLLSSLTVAFPTQAQLDDFTLTKKDANAAEVILSAATVYDRRAVGWAYANQRVLAKYAELRDDPNYRGDAKRMRMTLSQTAREALADVRGRNYRDGYAEAIAKDLISAASAAGTAALKARFPGYPGLSLPTETVKRAAGDLLDSMGTPPVQLKMEFQLIIQHNAHALRHADDKSPLGEQYKFLAAEFGLVNPDQNPNLAPAVRTERLRQSMGNQVKFWLDDFEKRTGTKIKALTEHQNDLAAHQKVFEQLQVRVTENLGDLTGRVSEFMATMDDRNLREEGRIQKQEKAERVAAGRTELMSAVGILTGLTHLTGDEKESAQFDKTGRFALAAYDVFNPLVKASTNPATFLNPYVTLLNLGVELFAPARESEGQLMFKALNQIMDQLRDLSRQIADLERHVTERLDALDQTLKTFIHSSNQKLRQLATATESTQFQLSEVAALVNQIHRETYGHYVFHSESALMQLTSRCLVGGSRHHRLTPADFKDCRNEMAHLAVRGLTPSTGSSLDAAPEVIDHLQRLRGFKAGSSHRGGDFMPYPSVWLTATQMLMEMAEQHPEHASLLGEDPYTRVPALNLARLTEIGAVYSSVTRDMAAVPSLGTGPRRLRRDLIARLVNDYAGSIRTVIDYVEGLPNKYLRGTPHPHVPLAHQNLSDSKETYTFLNEPLLFCDDPGKVWFDYVSAPDAHAFYKSSEAQMNVYRESVTKNAGQIRWPLWTLNHVPKTVRWALTSGFVDEQNGGLRVSTCLKKIQIARSGDHEMVTLGVSLRARYRMTMGEMKDLELVEWSRFFFIELSPGFSTFWFASVNESPLNLIWNGAWAGNSSWGGATFNEPIVATPEKGWDVESRGLAAFEKDFRDIIFRADAKVLDELERFENFDKQSDLARDTLMFVLERGLENNGPAVSELLNWVSSPRTWPSASEWAWVQYNFGKSRFEMERTLADRLATFERLLDEADRVGEVLPGPDVFGDRVRALERAVHPAKNARRRKW